MTRPPKTQPVVLAVFLGGFLVFGIVLALGIYLYTRPAGEAVGVVAIVPAPAELPVDVASGDTLHFTLDYAIDRRPFSKGLDNKAKERALNDALRRSTLNVSVRDAAGAIRTAACPTFSGKSRSSSGTLDELVREGVVVECSVPIAAAGRYLVRGEIAWDAQIASRWAKLEVRRATAAR